MPGLNGSELLAELRRGERTRSIPVILLSARAGEEAHRRDAQAGADDYLVKPFRRGLVARCPAHLDLGGPAGDGAPASGPERRLRPRSTRRSHLGLRSRIGVRWRWTAGPSYLRQQRR